MKLACGWYCFFFIGGREASTWERERVRAIIESECAGPWEAFAGANANLMSSRCDAPAWWITRLPWWWVWCFVTVYVFRPCCCRSNWMVWVFACVYVLNVSFFPSSQSILSSAAFRYENIEYSNSDADVTFDYYFAMGLQLPVVVEVVLDGGGEVLFLVFWVQFIIYAFIASSPDVAVMQRFNELSHTRENVR